MTDNPVLHAAAFARNAHAGQVRKWIGTPYILHPARVAARVMLLPKVEEHHVCAAWLHDVCEDCGVTLPMIQDVFGGMVVAYVHALTNPLKSDRPNMSRAARKAEDRERLGQYCAMVQNIKLIDRLDNLRDIHTAPRDFRKLYLSESRLSWEALTRADADLRSEMDVVLTVAGA